MRLSELPAQTKQCEQGRLKDGVRREHNSNSTHLESVHAEAGPVARVVTERPSTAGRRRWFGAKSTATGKGEPCLLALLIREADQITLPRHYLLQKRHVQRATMLHEA